jgi:hypothetical protein
MRDGHDTEVAEGMLMALEGTLEAFDHHRRIILELLSEPPP